MNILAADHAHRSGKECIDVTFRHESAREDMKKSERHEVNKMCDIAMLHSRLFSVR